MPKVVPEYKQAARERILQAASLVFAEKGYHQTTMEEIAKRLGVSKGALYLYFESKEELFKGIYESAPEALRGIFESTFKEDNPIKNSGTFFDRMMKQYASNPVLSFEVFSEATRNPVLRRILRVNYDKYAETTKKFIEHETNGLISKFYDSRSIALSLLALWNGMETLLIVGYPVSVVKRTWVESFKAMFAFASQATK